MRQRDRVVAVTHREFDSDRDEINRSTCCVWASFERCVQIRLPRQRIKFPPENVKEQVDDVKTLCLTFTGKPEWYKNPVFAVCIERIWRKNVKKNDHVTSLWLEKGDVGTFNHRNAIKKYRQEEKIKMEREKSLFYNLRENDTGFDAVLCFMIAPTHA